MNIAFEDPDFPLSTTLHPRKVSDAERQLQAFIDGIRERQPRTFVLVMPNMSLVHSRPPPSTYVRCGAHSPAVLDWMYWRAKPKLHREITWMPMPHPKVNE